MTSKFCKERRDVLKSGCVLAGAAALVSVGGSLNAFAAGGRGLQPQPPGAPQRGDTFVFSDGPNKGKEVTIADIVLDAPPITVQAKDETGAVRESEKATVLLYRVAADKYAVDIKGDTVEGVIAYSAVCTHKGCVITDWDATAKQIVCPCHKAAFDPLLGGTNTGGFKTRDLPQIPVKIHDGKLVIGDAIVSWIGVKRT
jgi:rieske iron-sulfur protein